MHIMRYGAEFWQNIEVMSGYFRTCCCKGYFVRNILRAQCYWVIALMRYYVIHTI